MLVFSTDMFHYDKELKMFSQESSSLDLSPRFWNSMMHIPVETSIKLQNNKTGGEMTFYFSKSDIANGEAYGWNYESNSGINLLIIND